jgi:hypothetical protein
MHFRRFAAALEGSLLTATPCFVSRIQVGVVIRELTEAEKEKEGSVVAWLTDIRQNSIYEVDPLLTTHQPDRSPPLPRGVHAIPHFQTATDSLSAAAISSIRCLRHRAVRWTCSSSKRGSYSPTWCEVSRARSSASERRVRPRPTPHRVMHDHGRTICRRCFVVRGMHVVRRVCGGPASYLWH